ncbi:Microsomal glutathione S-transferase 1 [Schistosoma japonicum]|uniref:Microsomal glutathione S-transferase 1 n=1 Tax=Schistosoma japonicum TaxID=6182 RepID=A0A4Z2DC80_SCHJA|nr:Microsomal glutathione S-transferase 1 [Schistosoma japonicum]KAH8868934.1 Microsomal glutathione S-transferase 1 [Schistosoma japonicum]TNN14101.1 Microsomal glutathione S-transferase 1 [Schistosoma japonicum]
MGCSNMRGAFAFYGSILAYKTLVLAGATIIMRMQKKPSCDGQPHPDVKAIYRCHLNDLENLVPFLILGQLYCNTDASLIAGLWHFRIFTLARILHTPAYLYYHGMYPKGPIFLVGYLVNISMGLKCISYFSGMW